MWTDGRKLSAVAVGVATLSLLINLYLIGQLRRPERLAGPAINRALEKLAAEDARIPYQIRIPAGTPIHFDIPLDERLSVKLNTRLPIDTQVRVPVRSPVGNYTVRLPIKANLPIQTELPLHIRHTFRLRTSTQTPFVVPLEIRVRDLPLDALRRSVAP